MRELWEWYLDGRVENGRVKVLWNYRMCRKSSVLAVGNIKGEIMYFELKEINHTVQRMIRLVYII